MKKLIIGSLLVLFAASLAVGQETNQQADQDYINKLYYRHNKLELLTRKRLIDEKRNYNDVDITSSTYYADNYTTRNTNITQQGFSKAEVKEINEWYIYLGGISEISDLEFLRLIGDNREIDRIQAIEDQKNKMRFIGNIFIGTGLTVMLGGAAFGAESKVVTGGALGMVVGFFIDAFNSTPAHYIRPAYAQAKIDEYNIAMKKRLNLPLNFE
ncbi:hypothetical protein A3K48_00565 [candidate division WOR-1 bacterium RIFOXYA12_FULL_52_29]|uniref:Uncharacterized protein n=1 Tax=candidate division WOR-1 bacterium RIFOXYC12_FULL_54_18 TaxID=1802584 RepID=A0A1F4T4V5_UNCSA|nr:MAG: hypothetical protein A3K44_00565 [candidate division WOR-1 bacterium RIFOXYA2_FULL_51_19]OGC17092.1 MAG: hypothetical protein A3K48_00565 [candidate division WOR-1 bacterium RIFOXYA12_FULL_52_29]OGC25952.1 MAG: hypothetical protein A3K32_00560 [candidate division WOR-1 bacterium RIFOXYB2_FULL_45_9]OGC27509.1 MAG: hypothetical protein A3K49_00565 [candidate division WOR-1 bacterium RIFOXYC12_FULL_54_18]OGC29279.1 MAG: hypothetical protein A2346_01145 [candidate division WOR-1 bacterium R